MVWSGQPWLSWALPTDLEEYKFAVFWAVDTHCATEIGLDGLC